MASNGHGPNKLALAAGFGIGVVWVITALYCLYSASVGAANDRPDFALAWGLVGAFLLAAGLCALVGTWWHNIKKPTMHEH